MNGSAEGGDPQAPLERRQARVALLAFACTLAVVGLLFVSPFGMRAALPGALSTSHAMLSEDCGACHADDVRAVQGFSKGLRPTALDERQSERCLVCHPWPDEPLQAHGWSDAKLAAERAPGADPLAPLACATCHHEHLGRDARLATLDDARCQACHAERFASFGDGHPALGRYPYRRRTAIAFDHAAHLEKHFPAEAERAPGGCTDCHVPSTGGRDMRTLGFERACAACHTDEIRGATRSRSAGFAFLALPALDLESLGEDGRDLAGWSADGFVSETRAPAFLLALLGADRELAPDLERVATLDLLDLSEAGEADKAAVARTARATIAFLEDLRERGQATIRERAERLRGRPLAPEEAAALAQGLPEDVVRASIAAWLPELADQDAAASEVDAADLLAEDRRREAWMELGGWYQRSLEGELLYRPAGHADPLLRAWLELALEAPPPVRATLLGELTRADAPGACTKCHPLQEGRDGPRLAWKAGPERPGRPRLTRFAHAPHFPSRRENACGACHVVAASDAADEAADASAAGGGQVAERTASGFRPLEPTTCSDCHAPGRASDACTTCHVYHARPVGVGAPSAPLASLAGTATGQPSEE